MKWLKRALAVLSLLVVGLGTVAVATAMKAPQPVGFQLMQVPDGAGGSFPTALWYPTTASPRPTTLIGMQLMDVAPDGPIKGSKLGLIVISHGNSGGPGSHVDLAMELAAAGYVVAAPMHTGDNYLDQSGLLTAGWLASRNREMRQTTDYLLAAWVSHGRLDPARVGAFGFSAGGYSVLAAVGAQPDLSLVAGHCARRPEFVCEMLRQVNSPLLEAGFVAPASLPDPRILAAVVAAPGLGFTMVGNALDGVAVPVQLWSANSDTTVPYSSNTKVIRQGLNEKAEFHAIPRAGHMSFLAPCGFIGPPLLCKDADDFDRKAFHVQMNARVIAFFDRQLGSGAVRN